jgi:DNA invertase Pin-like site-specific DNA recombinase
LNDAADSAADQLIALGDRNKILSLWLVESVSIAEYVEAERGKRSDRPKLAKALAHAKAIGATVVFAKLDRLTRNVQVGNKQAVAAVKANAAHRAANLRAIVDDTCPRLHQRARNRFRIE